MIANKQNEKSPLRQPYVIEPLLPVSENVYLFRVKFLSSQAEEAIEGLKEQILLHSQETFECNYHPFRLEAIGQQTSCTYEWLYQSSDPKSLLPKPVFQLYFISPTTFGPGKTFWLRQFRLTQTYPLPDPLRLFESLLYKWNTFTSLPFSFDKNLLSFVDRHLQITEIHDLTVGTICLGYTQRHRIEKNAFTGEVTYTLTNFRNQPSDALQEMLRAMLTLIRFAEWSGVGELPTMGMGYVCSRWGNFFKK